MVQVFFFWSCLWHMTWTQFYELPYHAHNKILRSAQYGHWEGCYSCFIGPFEDALYLYSRHNLYLLPPWCRTLLPHVKLCLYEASRSWLAGLNLCVTMTSQYCVTQLTDHGTLQHAIFISPLPWRFDHSMSGVNVICISVWEIHY